MRILNFGSLNVDLVYRVGRIVRPGETISSDSFSTFAGGKGANQSAALAKAGATVYHAGKVGHDGRWLVDKLKGLGVVTRFIRAVNSPTGHAVIQVDDAGENAIFLFPGTNHAIRRDEVDRTLGYFREGEYVLLQNEINEMSYIIHAAHERGLRVCLNPAPMDRRVARYPLRKVGVLVLNETEAATLTGGRDRGRTLECLTRKMPNCEIVLTLGAGGAVARSLAGEFRAAARRVRAVDTTAAGDTFIGYYLRARMEGKGIESALALGCAAAAICVTRRGAMDSIPFAREVRV